MDVYPKTRPLTCGVPQGTILGPLLFLLYINDLPNCLSHSQPRMFADDTHLTYADNDIAKIELNLTNDLESIREWLIVNKLTLNMSKTEFMVIGSRQRLYTFDNAPDSSTYNRRGSYQTGEINQVSGPSH